MEDEAKMYLAEAKEAENVEWLKFASVDSVKSMDAVEQKTVRDFWRYAFQCGWRLGVKKAFELGEAESASEVQRLTTALHAAKAHPDFSYIVVPAKSEFTPNAAVFGAGQGGWERNVETPASALDETWRRKREAT